MGLVAASSGCTKQQTVNTVNTGVQVAVDLCQEAPQLLPPTTPVGAVVALVCPAVVAGAPPVTVFVDKLIWDAMKAQAAARKSGQMKALTQ